MSNIINNPVQEATLIELREQDSIKSTSEQNGEYTVHLQEPLTIKAGETIALKSGFVDSVAENSGNIFVSEEETNVEFDFFLYQSQIDMRGKVRNGIYDATYTGDDVNDTLPYLVCNKIAAGSNITKVDSLSFHYGGRFHGLSGNLQGGVNYHVKYESADSTDQNPKFQQFSVKIPVVAQPAADPILFFTINSNTPDGDNNIFLPLNIRFGTKMFHNEDQASKDLDKAGVRLALTQGSQDSQNQDTLQPFLYKVKINLISGFYDPTHLAKIMTDKMQAVSASTDVINKVFTTDKPAANNFLRTIDEIYVDFGIDQGTANDKDEGLFLVRATDGSAIMQIPSGTDYPNNSGNAVNSAPKKYIFGCSEPAIEYDDELKRFKLLLHTPLFEANSALVVKVVESNTLAPTNEFRYSGSAGGAILNSVSPHSLFQKLGFLDIPNSKTAADFSDDLLCGLAQVNHVTLGAFNNITTFKIPNLKMSKNLTSAYTSVAVTYPNKGTFTPITLADDVTATPSSGFAVVTLEPILAQNSINNIQLQNPYFIIEVSGFDNKLKGVNNTFTNIMAIVSRYQSIDNFTSFYSEGSPSVPYIHKGLPIQINNFKIKILNPNKEVCDNLGPSNSIYLEHIKDK